MTCVIAAPVVDTIHQHLTAEYPREGCGLLVGQDRPEERRIEYAVPARNDDPIPSRRYAIAAEDFLKAEKEARRQGREIVGFYHSHPDSGPAPSLSDAAEAWPHYTYLIVSVLSGRSGAMATWRFEGRRRVYEVLRVSATSGPP
jgi:proteasome lid subunit RPN8/RPN11